MSDSRQYFEYAQECVRWAARAEIEEDRVCFLQMADAWTKVALVKADGARQSAFEERPTCEEDAARSSTRQGGAGH